MKVKGPILRLKQHFTYKYGSITHRKEGLILNIWGDNTKKKTLKSRTFSSPSPKRNRRSSPFWLFFFSLNQPQPIFPPSPDRPQSSPLNRKPPFQLQDSHHISTAPISTDLPSTTVHISTAASAATAIFTVSNSSAVLASEPAAHTRQCRGNTLHLLPPAAPADPTTSSDSLNTTAPRDQQPPFLLLPASRSGGEDEKPIEEQICSEADLKEKRKRQIRKQWKKVKTVCLLRFLCFAGHCQRGKEEEKKPL